MALHKVLTLAICAVVLAAGCGQKPHSYVEAKVGDCFKLNSSMGMDKIDCPTPNAGSGTVIMGGPADYLSAPPAPPAKAKGLCSTTPDYNACMEAYHAWIAQSSFEAGRRAAKAKGHAQNFTATPQEQLQKFVITWPTQKRPFYVMAKNRLWASAWGETIWTWREWSETTERIKNQGMDSELFPEPISYEDWLREGMKDWVATHPPKDGPVIGCNYCGPDLGKGSVLDLAPQNPAPKEKP